MGYENSLVKSIPSYTFFWGYQKLYRFETTRKWLIHDRIFIFLWTIPLRDCTQTAICNEISITKTLYYTNLFIFYILHYFPCNLSYNVHSIYHIVSNLYNILSTFWVFLGQHGTSVDFKLTHTHNCSLKCTYWHTTHCEMNAERVVCLTPDGKEMRRAKMTQQSLMIKLSFDLDYYKNRSLRRQGPTTPSTLMTTPITKLTSIAAGNLPAPLSHLNALLNTEDSSICCPVASALRSDIQNTAQSLTAVNDGIKFTSALICNCTEWYNRRTGC